MERGDVSHRGESLLCDSSARDKRCVSCFTEFTLSLEICRQFVHSNIHSRVFILKFKSKKQSFPLLNPDLTAICLNKDAPPTVSFYILLYLSFLSALMLLYS